MANLYEIRHLQYRYQPKQEYVVKDLNLNIQEGQIFGLLGPSGAGKSTTQKILIKLLPGYEGEILFRGKPLKQWRQNFYENIGVGFEMPVHFNKLTAEENLKYFASLYQRKIDFRALLVRVGLGEAMQQPVGQFSKGMKMRLNFVKALLNDPEVLFLDEPTNGLDPSNARIIKDMILEQKQRGKTILITTHLMGDVEELCDDVAFIAQGKLIETATPKALKLKYGKRELKVEFLNDEQLASTTFPLDQLASNPSFHQLIKEKTIVTMHSQETSLDKIFIEITGKHHD
ncbi:MAG: ABC transporter ATP-binding protein [Bacilli bacterium]